MADKHMSRREMLRNAGLVGVAAWAVPVLTSLPAHASTQKKLCKKKNGDICDGYVTACGSCGSLDGSYCFDTKGNDKKVFCGADDYCSNLQVCGKGIGKCPTGYKCSYRNGCSPNICDETQQGVCIQVCHTGPVSNRSRVVKRPARGTAASVR